MADDDEDDESTDRNKRESKKDTLEKGLNILI